MSGNTGFGEVIELFGEEETVLKVLLELVVAGLGGVNIFGDWIRPGGGFLIFGTFSANISKPKRVPELVLIDFLSFSLTLASASAILCLFFSDFSCLSERKIDAVLHQLASFQNNVKSFVKEKDSCQNLGGHNTDASSLVF